MVRFLMKQTLCICFSLWIHNLPVTPVLKFWPTFQTSNNEKNQQSLPTPPYKVCCPLFNLILVSLAFDVEIHIIVVVIKSLLLKTYSLKSHTTTIVKLLLLWFDFSWISLYIMAFPVVEISREGYKIRKVFG